MSIAPRPIFGGLASRSTPARRSPWSGIRPRASRAKFCHPEHVFGLTTPWWEIILRTAFADVCVQVPLRVAGKRELGQMSAVDLVVILVIANAVQNAMTGGDNSLIGGIIAASTLVAMNLIFGRVANRIPLLEHLFTSEPTLLIDDGKLIQTHLQRENITREDVEMSAREHGIGDLSDVEAAILERDGSISIIPREGRKTMRTVRRIRQLRNRP